MPSGGPTLSLYFILWAEILAILIRNNADIKGIIINDRETKISLYADDASLILDDSERSLMASLKILEKFDQISGLKINYSKTEVIWICSKAGSKYILCRNYNLEWGKTTFQLLRIQISINLKDITNHNMVPKIIKIKNSLKQWKKKKPNTYWENNCIKNTCSF